MTSIDIAAPDLAAVKQRQQAAWASGDFAVVAARIVLVAEQLCDTADLHAGWRVLDVATGSGNAAIAAARLGCTAVGVDYVPALLEAGESIDDFLAGFPSVTREQVIAFLEQAKDRLVDSVS